MIDIFKIQSWDLFLALLFPKDRIVLAWVDRTDWIVALRNRSDDIKPSVLQPSPWPLPNVEGCLPSLLPAIWQEDRFDSLITQGHTWLFLTVLKGRELALDWIGHKNVLEPSAPSSDPLYSRFFVGGSKCDCFVFLLQNYIATQRTWNLPLTGGALKKISGLKVTLHPYSQKRAICLHDIPVWSSKKLNQSLILHPPYNHLPFISCIWNTAFLKQRSWNQEK